MHLRELWGHVAQIPPAARQILSYFVRNPSAVDSLEGIAKWRLLEEEIHRGVLETQQALEWLSGQGYLIESMQAHTGKLYSFNAAKRAEVQSLLHAERPPGPHGDRASGKDETK